MKKLLRIEEMYAFVATDPSDNTEGIMGFLGPDKIWMAMVGADMDRINSLKPFADMIAKKTGIKYKILRFSKREEIG